MINPATSLSNLLSTKLLFFFRFTMTLQTLCLIKSRDIWPLAFSWRRQWHPTPVLLPGKSHGWRSLIGCSPWGRYELDTTERLHFHALEMEMATHSSVLAWRIPGTGEPGGLPSMGSHRVGHDWSDLAAAAAFSWIFWVKLSNLIWHFWLLLINSCGLLMDTTLFPPCHEQSILEFEEHKFCCQIPGLKSWLLLLWTKAS